MAIVLDTGVLYAYYDQRDSWHSRSFELIDQEQRELIVPSPVIPEVDYLLGKRLGMKAQSAFYQGLVDGYTVADLALESYGRVIELNEQFADLKLGFVDAAVVAVAEAIDLRRIATADRRHFGALAEPLGLELLP